MEYNTTYIKISTGGSPPTWRQALIVSSDKPLAFSNPRTIHREETAEGITTTTVYTTNGKLYRHLEEAGRHYYWFLVERVETSQSVSPEAYREQLAINDILTGGDGHGTDQGTGESLPEEP